MISIINVVICSISISNDKTVSTEGKDNSEIENIIE